MGAARTQLLPHGRKLGQEHALGLGPSRLTSILDAQPDARASGGLWCDLGFSM